MRGESGDRHGEGCSGRWQSSGLAGRRARASTRAARRGRKKYARQRRKRREGAGGEEEGRKVGGGQARGWWWSGGSERCLRSAAQKPSLVPWAGQLQAKCRPIAGQLQCWRQTRRPWQHWRRISSPAARSALTRHAQTSQTQPATSGTAQRPRSRQTSCPPSSTLP